METFIVMRDTVQDASKHQLLENDDENREHVTTKY